VRVSTFLAEHAERLGISRADVDRHMGTSDMGGWWLTRLRHRCQVPTWEQWLRLRELLGFDDEKDAEVWRLNGRKGSPGEAWGKREVVGEGFRVRRESQVQIAGGAERRRVPDHRPGDQRGPPLAGLGHRPQARFRADRRRPQTPGRDGRRQRARPRDGRAQHHGVSSRRGGCVNDAGGASSLQRVSRVEQGYRSTVTTSQNEAVTVEGRWPTNVVLSHAPLLDEHGQVIGDGCEDGCVPGCPVADLDGQSGNLHTQRPTNPSRMRASHFGGGRESVRQNHYDDSGTSPGASRFFPTFRYEAKAPDWERPRVNGVAHPTVKPLDLIRWLCRLVTPPSGLVLDMFAGSGTTGEAALMEGFERRPRRAGGRLSAAHPLPHRPRPPIRLQPGMARTAGRRYRSRPTGKRHSTYSRDQQPLEG
jgi:hypothetical protein